MLTTILLLVAVVLLMASAIIVACKGPEKEKEMVTTTYVLDKLRAEGYTDDQLEEVLGEEIHELLFDSDLDTMVRILTEVFGKTLQDFEGMLTGVEPENDIEEEEVVSTETPVETATRMLRARGICHIGDALIKMGISGGQSRILDGQIHLAFSYGKNLTDILNALEIE